MHVLVTGGAGYIGSHAARALVAQGHAVRVLDDLSTGHRAAVHPEAELVVGDVRDPGIVAEAVAGVDAVMHFAARSIVGESFPEALGYWDTNVRGSLTLLGAMREAGVRRLVFSSTAATYGAPDALPITEDTPQRPINPYGASKLAVEHAIRDVAGAGQLSAAVLRYFNVAGCAADGSLGEDHHPETHLIPLILQAAAGRRAEVAVFGDDYPTPDGTCIRDYVHVEDLVDAHLDALDALDPDAPGCGFYNVGIGRGISVLEMIEAAKRVTGVDFPVRIAARRAGDPPSLWTDPTRIQRELGWTPRRTNVAEMVATAWAWARRHPDGYGDRPATRT